MATTIAGLFDGFTQADHAVRVLVGSGFSSDDISILIHTNRGAPVSTGVEKGNKPAAGDNAVHHELGNIIVGRLTLLVPAMGLLGAAGPLVTALARTTLNAPSCGLLDALTAIGIAEEHVGYYAEGVRRGGIFIAVRTSDRMADRAEDIMAIHKVADMQKQTARWRQSGWVNFTPETKPLSTEEMARECEIASTEHPRASDFHIYETDFRSHFYIITSESLASSYEHYAPAYRYGYLLAYDQRYSDKEWFIIEAAVRRDWEKQNQGTWEQFVEAVGYGFLKARAHRLPCAA
jgi:hypothetical protein